MSEQKTENKNNNNLVKIVIGIIIFALLGFFAWSHFSGSSKNPIENIVETIKGNGGESEDFNYAFKFEGQVESFDEAGQSLGSGSLSIGESQIYSSSNALKQRLNLKDVKVVADSEEVFKLDSIDVVSDYFKNYFYFESENKADILSSLENVEYFPTLNSVAKVFSNSGTYVMVDYEKTVLGTIGDLAQNETIKNLFLATALSNPTAFLEENGTLKKLGEELKSDKFLDYVFTNNGEVTEFDGKEKQTLMFNDTVCGDFIPLVSNMFSGLAKASPEIYGSQGVDLQNINLQQTDCEKAITNTNSTLQFITQIYKIGDIKGGNYDFVASMNSFFELKVTYKSHKLKTWNISSKSMIGGEFVLNIAGDENGVTNSLLKLDFKDDFSGFSIVGEIVDGQGEITLDSTNKDNGAFGKIIVQDYYLEDIDIKAFIDSEEKFSIKGKIVKGLLDIKIKSDVSKGKANMDFVVKEDYLKMFVETDGVEEGIVDFVYDRGDIDGKIQNEDMYVSLKGFYKNFKDFSIKVTDENNPEKNYGFAEAKREGQTIKYDAKIIMDSELETLFEATLSGGEKDDYKTVSFVGEVFSKQEMQGGKLKFNYELSYKKDGAKFEIPKNFEEVEASYFEIVSLPPMHPKILKKQLEYAKYIMIPIAVITYYTLEDYPRQARNKAGYYENSNYEFEEENYEIDDSYYDDQFEEENYEVDLVQ